MIHNYSFSLGHQRITMRHLLLIIFSIITFPSILAQTLKGKVYDSKSVVKDIKVINKTQNRFTVTDEDGNFNIIAKVNDTISFESIFYKPLDVILTQSHFEQDNVFEVQKITNELDEVEVLAEPEQPVFEEETYNTDLHNLIKEDIKRNPGAYRPIGTNQGVDFVYLFKKLIDLFKRKKPKKNEETLITYDQFSKLIEYHSLFNTQLITKDLKIPEKHKFLFLEFCAAKGISSNLLKEENTMQLLEELVTNSQLFLILLEEYGDEKTVKD